MDPDKNNFQVPPQALLANFLRSEMEVWNQMVEEHLEEGEKRTKEEHRKKKEFYEKQMERVMEPGYKLEHDYGDQLSFLEKSSERILHITSFFFAYSLFIGKIDQVLEASRPQENSQNKQFPTDLNGKAEAIIDALGLGANRDELPDLSPYDRIRDRILGKEQEQQQEDVDREITRSLKKDASSFMERVLKELERKSMGQDH